MRADLLKSSESQSVSGRKWDKAKLYGKIVARRKKERGARLCPS